VRERSYKAWTEDCSEIDPSPTKEPENFSYNMAMTTSALVICPRTRDSCSLGPIGDVTLNGTMLAGTFMVKDEKLWEFIKREPQVPMNVMRTVGILPPFDGRASFL
jgi:ATP adenylyltransferase